MATNRKERVAPSPTERKLAAQKFAEEWAGRGQEDKHDQTFWNQFLGEVMGISRVHHEIDYQKRVTIPHHGTKRIDAYIPASKVLIEQKSLNVDLDHPAAQSDGEELTPYEQAVRYAQWLPAAERPDWIVISNFASFRIYDTREDFNQEPIIVTLEELPENLKVFDFIIRKITEKIAKEEKANREAAVRIGDLYRKIAAQYPDPETARHDLSVLMVRILFCLYAEDSGLMDTDQFTLYLKANSANLTSLRHALIDVFAVLSTPLKARATNLDFNDALVLFPYVNGGLFESEIQIPALTDDIKLELLVSCANFNWADISPVIFGSIFESILSGDERRAGGMHYTSPANIHKVIDPLFLDGLRSELNVAGHDKTKLLALQTKMADLKFLDPACGSGNFLTQTYIDLRRMENDLLDRLHADGQTGWDFDVASSIKVNVAQFYGIEINDFAVSVASTALWIADHQANQETSRILDHPYVNLPLKKLHNIICENALRYDWEELLPASECDYVMGNPPFIGYSNQDTEQKAEMLSIWIGEDGKLIKDAGKIDYVTAWYYLAACYIQGTDIKVAFVSTNSITQGEQVVAVWKTLIEQFGIHIDFAWRTFVWNNEAANQAHVHVVVVGFSVGIPGKMYLLKEGIVEEVSHINPYLVDANDVFISSRSKPICDVPDMVYGNKPTDGGFLFVEADEYDEFIKKEPGAAKYIKRIYGATEFINNKPRYCLWLVGADPSDIRKMPLIRDRVEAVRNFRLTSPKRATRESAATPSLFQEVRQPDTDYILVPRHSSEKRAYIPFGFVDPAIVVNDAVQIIPGANLYHFGILTSAFHMAWVRVVCGRIKSDYRYSKDIVYNNFIWPDVTDEQKQEIERVAQAVLDVRANYPESSLADLYDPLAMPPDLLKAHKALDRAVEKAYRVRFNGNEEKIVGYLFKLYSQRDEVKGANND